jgi:hypothetical protein
MTCARVYDRRRYWSALWRKRDYPFALNLVPMLVEFDRQGMIGPLVLDLGCSCNPVTNWLNMSEHKRILLDISEDIPELAELGDGALTACCDLCTFTRHTADFQVFAETFQKTGATGLDAIISADNLINYIPWQPVFTILDEYLKNSGLVFLCFGINIGRGEAFHPDRPATSADVLSFFQDELGYRIVQYGSQKECYGVALQKVR